MAASHPLWALLGVNDEAIAALNSQLPPASQVSLSDSPAAAAATLHATLKALPPEHKEAMLEHGAAGVPKSLLTAIVELDSDDVEAIATDLPLAAKLVVPSALPPQVRSSIPAELLDKWSAFERADVGGGGQRPAEAVSRLHARCTKLPAPAKEAVTAAVYERVREGGPRAVVATRTALSAIGSMRPDEVTTMAETMQDIIPKAAALSQSQAAAVEAAPGGEDAAPRDEKAAAVEAGKLALQLLRAVPPASRAALAEGLHDRDLALADEQRAAAAAALDAAELATGLEDDELETLAANVAAIGGGGDGAAAAAADDDGYGYAGEPLWVSCARFWCCLCCCFPLPKSVTDTPEFRKGVPTAGILGRAEARSLWQWVRGDPCALRILNFGAGLTLVVVGWLGIWIEAFNSFRVVSMMLDFYVAVGGGVLAAVEVKSALCQSYAVPALRRYVGFLTAARGRGVFMLLLALVSLATVSDDAAVEALNLYATVVLCVLGSFNIAVGAFAERRLAGARARLRSRDEVRAAFAAADRDGSGALDADELADLLPELGVVLSPAEARAAMAALDRNGDRRVSEDELLAWWSGAPASARARSAHARPFAWRDATLLQRVTVSAVALYAGGAALALILRAASADDGVDAIHTVVDALCVALGAGALALELRVDTRARCGGADVVAAILRDARFLARRWGRGLFYMFIAALALSQYVAAEWPALVGGSALWFVGAANFAAGVNAARQYEARKVKGVDAHAVSVAFARADRSHTGTLDTAELPALLAELGLVLGREDLEIALTEMDVSGDGVVSLGEFLEWYFGGDHADDGADHGEDMGAQLNESLV